MMEIVCDSCHAKLNIPDEKLPAGQKVGIKCPRCGNKLIVETPPAKPEPSEAASQAVERPAAEHPAQTPEPLEGLDEPEADKALVSYGEGEKLALVMIPETQPLRDIEEALAGLGYGAIHARNTREALAKMQVQHFDLLILSDPFDDTPLAQSPILQYLNHLSMSVRRRMFLVLLSDAFQTMDLMMAYAMSANMVANWKDLGKLSNILRRAIADHERFYKVFMDTLKETGKA